MPPRYSVVCSVPGCPKPFRALGFCREHEYHFRLGRTPAMKPSKEERFWSWVNKNGPTQPHMESACWVWTRGTVGMGYGVLHHDGRSRCAHRVSWSFAHSDPGDMCVLHRCDHPPCVRVDHLFLGTRAVNNFDMISKGRDRKRPLPGEDNGASKLTRAQVEEIRRLCATRRYYQREIAALFGVTQTLVSQIARRKVWL